MQEIKQYFPTYVIHILKESFTLFFWQPVELNFILSTSTKNPAEFKEKVIAVYNIQRIFYFKTICILYILGITK